MGEGLRRVLKAYGRMIVQGEMWVWDYAAGVPVKEKYMQTGSARHARSERARIATFKGEAKR